MNPSSRLHQGARYIQTWKKAGSPRWPVVPDFEHDPEQPPHRKSSVRRIQQRSRRRTCAHAQKLIFPRISHVCGAEVIPQKVCHILALHVRFQCIQPHVVAQERFHARIEQMSVLDTQQLPSDRTVPPALITDASSSAGGVVFACLTHAADSTAVSTLFMYV